MGKGFPIDGMSIDERSESGTCIFNEVTAFPGLKAEMDQRQSEMSGDRHFIGGICTNADGSIRKEEGMALGGAERCHGSGEYHKSKGKLRFSKGQFR